MKRKRTNKNIEELVKSVVDGWGLDELIDYAKQQLTEYYKKDKKGFNADWESVMKEQMI